MAQLYTRDVITAVAAGSQRFFWFSADDTPEYGFTVFFGDYVPRPRLAALAACASFIEGTTFQKTLQSRQQHVRPYVPGNEHGSVRLLE